MSSLTCAALLHLFVSTAPSPLVPPAALPEAVQEHPSAAAPPRWSAQALAAWGGPWVMRPGYYDHYDHRYITW